MAANGGTRAMLDTHIQELTQVEAMGKWNEAESYLRLAVTDDDPENYLRTVQSFVFSGIHTLWRLSDDQNKTTGYAVTAIYTNNGIVSVAQIYLATTEALKNLMEHMDLLHSWAIQHKVNYLEILGRKGWEKVLRPYGFTHNHTSLLKRIDQELH